MSNDSQVRSTGAGKRWPWAVLALVTLIVGLLVGAVAGSGVPQEEFDALTERAAATADDLDSATAELGELRAERADVRSREAELDTREQSLDQRTVALDTREQEIGAAEAQIAANTIPGTGTFVVGEDVAPGTYRTAGSSGCYWARLSGTSGDLGDVLANGLSDGPLTVTIAPSDEAFETQRCGEWTLR